MNLFNILFSFFPCFIYVQCLLIYNVNKIELLREKNVENASNLAHQIFHTHMHLASPVGKEFSHVWRTSSCLNTLRGDLEASLWPFLRQSFKLLFSPHLYSFIIISVFGDHKPSPSSPCQSQNKTIPLINWKSREASGVFFWGENFLSSCSKD